MGGAAALVCGDEVGKSAADIDTNPGHRICASNGTPMAGAQLWPEWSNSKTVLQSKYSSTSRILANAAGSLGSEDPSVICSSVNIDLSIYEIDRTSLSPSRAHAV